MNLKVSSSPHIRAFGTTGRVMLNVIAALIPALGVSTYFFGLRVLVVVSVTIASCVIFEYISRKIMKRDNTITDLSAVVTGLLLAFTLSPATPLWICVLGAFVAIVVAKQMFGGIGNNFVNPAILARIVLAVSFPVQIGSWKIASAPGAALSNFADSVSGADLISSATPLGMLASGSTELPTYLELFLGNRAGSLGEVSVIALLLGGIYLIARGLIKIWIPISFCIGTVIIVLLSGGDPMYHLISGGLILGAFFMATDYVTSPLTNPGKIIFGLGCGLITGLIRIYGNLPEGVAFSILIMNIVTPHIDKLTIPVPFGGGKKHAKQKA
ncbi:MAG: RnfABCDGE type electron transport complex subunit D [Eubacteriales bacterium]|nr:RnfABCDGE type electron transport complex subunit D [Eubacteriales bacterium]MDD4327954.1 RnfABCDGE type electron transport complex subunit D [Eubacteriales bacterium]MDD4717588.1 RnfABCDGE type electron transport complex subunit D [Eubacteriales bacterium]NCU25369.1 RnfABCDGE type electron transport complex subunit D [Candidatus Nomurabacteria bacterium]